MSNISERKRKLNEILALAKKTSWRRKSLEKRIGEITTYLSQSVAWFSVEYSERQKVIHISAYSTYQSEVHMLGFIWYSTSTFINKSIVIFIEQLLDDFNDYEQQE